MGTARILAGWRWRADDDPLRTAAVALVVVGVAAPSSGGSPRRQQQPRFGRGAADDGPVPVIAALTKRADVPVYLDGVGTIKALNTVTVLPQVDGRLLSVNFTEGQDVAAGYVLAKIDPVTYQAAYDQAVAKKAQDEATLANGTARSRALHQARGHQFGGAPAARHPEGDGRAARSPGEARPGGDRQRQGDSRLHQHRRADRRAHRHPPGRPGQLRARRGLDRHRCHHPAAADLGAVHAAAAATRRRQSRLRQSARLQVDAFGPDNKTVGR